MGLETCIFAHHTCSFSITACCRLSSRSWNTKKIQNNKIRTDANVLTITPHMHKTVNNILYLEKRRKWTEPVVFSFDLRVFAFQVLLVFSFLPVSILSKQYFFKSASLMNIRRYATRRRYYWIFHIYVSGWNCNFICVHYYYTRENTINLLYT